MRGDLLPVLVLVWCLSSPIWTYGLGGTEGYLLQAVPCTEAGPTIIPLMLSSLDAISNASRVDLALVLRANVTDATGVVVVIGGYCNTSEGVWRNATMHIDPDIPEGHIFTSHPLNFTLQRGHSSGVLWNITFYAQNAVGIWSTANTLQGFTCWFVPTETTTTTTNGAGPDLAVAAAVITVAIIVAVAVLLRPKKGYP